MMVSRIQVAQKFAPEVQRKGGREGGGEMGMGTEVRK